jgi:hypothetical protein
MEEDGFAATKLFNHGYSYTYDDVIFLPHYIDFSTDNISLSTCLTRRVPLLSLVLSSPMDTVTEGALAAAMASLGGLGIVHSNIFVVDQAFVVHSVKSRCVPILSAPTFCAPSKRIHSLDDFESYPYVLVTQSGSASQLLCYISDWLKGVEESGRLFREKLEGKIVFLCLTKSANSIHANAVTKRRHREVAQKVSFFTKKKKKNVVFLPKFHTTLPKKEKRKRKRKRKNNNNNNKFLIFYLRKLLLDTLKKILAAILI